MQIIKTESITLSILHQT